MTREEQVTIRIRKRRLGDVMEVVPQDAAVVFHREGDINKIIEIVMPREGVSGGAPIVSQVFLATAAVPWIFANRPELADRLEDAAEDFVRAVGLRTREV